MSSSKRIRIRAPGHVLNPKANDIETGWPVLANAIDMIYERRESTLSFEELYRLVYDLVLRKFGRELRTRILDTLQHKIWSAAKTEIPCTAQAAEFVDEMYALWERQHSCLNAVWGVTMYIDSSAGHSHGNDIYSVALMKMQNLILAPVLPRIVRYMLDELNRARESGVQAVNMQTYLRAAALARSLWLPELGPSSDLTKQLLEDTHTFYSSWRKKHADNPMRYIMEVDTVLKTEVELLRELGYTDATIKTCRTMVIEVLVSENIGFILPICLQECIDAGDEENLDLLLSLCTTDQDASQFLVALSECVEKEGMAIPDVSVSKRKADAAVAWVKALTKLRTKYTSPFKKYTDSNGCYLKTIGDALAALLSNQPAKTVDYLVMSIDSVLRSNTTLEEEQQELLERCISFFILMRDKDLFELSYRQQLSKRLLQRKSPFHLEQWMVGKMTQEVGIHYTSNLEGMLRDVKLSQGYSAKFSAPAAAAGAAYQMDVLTPTFWPFQQVETLAQDITLPDELAAARSSYEGLYVSQHSGRRLKWAYHLGSVEIGHQFGQSYHELTMSTYAATIFLLFRDYAELTTEQIQDLTAIPDAELQRQLISLAVAPRTRILTKTPPSRTIAPSDHFAVNTAFTAPTTKVRVATVVVKSEQAAALPDVLAASRVQAISAAVVRQLKTERTMAHTELQDAAVRALQRHFAVSTSMFKRAIQSLLEKEYIQRDAHSPDRYHYLA
ncbi:AFR498Wp [Eremothecium gossypii ATCC 10895]|uniref:AFR498Wp n=1 Tax=Eremothecium gossypii (strain ATCC 10895 / CBS 109.51 / FGSC 9923 / NRRL Y-1056) TaxID=284811 RepID=Q752S5_EREGS|nr:AFR498Wp [Eremothecium gossypii ATCC 10895]AAS53869.2 AFR498Wp [Eremothecium gossypii ATCC 10895]AEY98182.1 FAFR498Wp [Eremothecium gossypii FDAG1]